MDFTSEEREATNEPYLVFSDTLFEGPVSNSDSEVPSTSESTEAEVTVPSNAKINEIPHSENEPEVLLTSATLNESAQTFQRYRKRSRLRSPEPTEEEDGTGTLTATSFTGDVQALANDPQELISIVWRKKHLQLHVNEIVFRGERVCPPTFKELDSPYKCFCYFMNDELFQHLSEQTSLYTRQQNINTQIQIYTGAGDNTILPNTPDLGAASNVVVRLSQHIPNFVNHILYFDNFYTSLGLLVYLRSRGIYSLGTVRINRVPNCKL
ncbi:hypothetical protein NQ318_022828 [Aromia moschata]|uniref:PiggyBac transposable element-derived protein domain-containing protein n=1 Tax=Aromia moschata TaxID=1265417 RepID=A0AAV8XVV0_9CUCU|nr:hypothetical protein NQ318_022828 [Aromia moschata]